MRYKDIVYTPLGEMLVEGDFKHISRLEFIDETEITEAFQRKRFLESELIHKKLPIFNEVQHQLNQYFKGKRKQFNLSLCFIGTDFQKWIWKNLQEIPYGTTWSYKQQAEYLGDKKKIRAVANANAQNKIAIIVPCHRVIGANGHLTGYAGGVERKAKLLNIEGIALF